MDRTVLILGATGGIGGEAARALTRHGWSVRALTRTLRAGLDPMFEWVEGDALDPAAVARAAAGVAALVHAVNPPGYRDWDRLVLPMLESSIAAARSADARLVLPGTVYNYDPTRQHAIDETTPQQPNTRKGRIRVQMEARIEAACDEGLRALILRPGDFFGPRPGQSWFSQAMVRPGSPVRAVTLPGRAGVGHSWAYLPDVAETFARLLEREAALPAFASFHFAGHYDPDGTAIADSIARVTGQPDLKRKPLPWWLLRLIAPFNASLREMLEIRQYWRHTLRIENPALRAFLGEEPHTPLDAAMRATLIGLCCLSEAAGQ